MLVHLRMRLALSVVATGIFALSANAQYLQTNLVSDSGAGGTTQKTQIW